MSENDRPAVAIVPPKVIVDEQDEEALGQESPEASGTQPQNNEEAEMPEKEKGAPAPQNYEAGDEEGTTFFQVADEQPLKQLGEGERAHETVSAEVFAQENTGIPDDPGRAMAVSLSAVQAAATQPSGEVVSTSHTLVRGQHAAEVYPSSDTETHNLDHLQQLAEGEEESVSEEAVNAALAQGVPGTPAQTEVIEEGLPVGADQILSVDHLTEEQSPLGVAVNATMPIQERVIEYLTRVLETQKVVAIAFAWFMAFTKVKLDSDANLSSVALRWTKDGLDEELSNSRREALSRLAFLVFSRSQLRDGISALQVELDQLTETGRRRVQKRREEADLNLGGWGQSLESLRDRLRKEQDHLRQTEELFGSFNVPDIGDVHAQPIRSAARNHAALLQSMQQVCEDTAQSLSEAEESSAEARADLQARKAEEELVQKALDELEGLRKLLAKAVTEIDQEWASLNQQIEEAGVSFDGVEPESEAQEALTEHEEKWQAALNLREQQWQEHHTSVLDDIFGRLRMFVPPEERGAWEDTQAMELLFQHVSGIFSYQRNEISSLSVSVQGYEVRSGRIYRALMALIKGDPIDLSEVDSGFAASLETLGEMLSAKKVSERQAKLLVKAIKEGGEALTEEELKEFGGFAQTLKKLKSSTDRNLQEARLPKLQDEKDKACEEADELRSELSAYSNEPTYKKQYADLSKDPLVKYRKVLAGAAAVLLFLVLILILALVW